MIAPQPPLDPKTDNLSAAADPGARLVLYSYRRLRTTLPFEFRDLPLP